jgi:dTDP-4-dehydrorhamnose 3,5-epimerase-like enzyme
VAWDDPEIGVVWPHPPRTLSERDRAAPGLQDLLPDLRRWFPSA